MKTLFTRSPLTREELEQELILVRSRRDKWMRKCEELQEKADNHDSMKRSLEYWRNQDKHTHKVLLKIADKLGIDEPKDKERYTNYGIISMIESHLFKGRNYYNGRPNNPIRALGWKLFRYLWTDKKGYIWMKKLPKFIQNLLYATWWR